MTFSVDDHAQVTVCAAARVVSMAASRIFLWPHVVVRCLVLGLDLSSTRNVHRSHRSKPIMASR